MNQDLHQAEKLTLSEKRLMQRHSRSAMAIMAMQVNSLSSADAKALLKHCQYRSCQSSALPSLAYLFEPLQDFKCSKYFVTFKIRNGLR